MKFTFFDSWQNCGASRLTRHIPTSPVAIKRYETIFELYSLVEHRHVSWGSCVRIWSTTVLFIIDSMNETWYLNPYFVTLKQCYNIMYWLKYQNYFWHIIYRLSFKSWQRFTNTFANWVNLAKGLIVSIICKPFICSCAFRYITNKKYKRNNLY